MTPSPLKKVFFLLAVAAIASTAVFTFMTSSCMQVIHASPEQAEWMVAPQILARQRRLFAQEHVDVHTDYWPTGKKALSALHNELAHVSTAGSAPLIAASQQNTEFLILGRSMQSDKMVHLFIAKDHVGNWVEHPISLARGTVSELFLMAHLRRLGMLDHYKARRLTLVESEMPESTFTHLKDGTTKSAVLFNPFALIAKARDTDNQFIDATMPTVFQTNMFYVTTRQNWTSKRSEILAMMAAIKRASDEVTSNPKGSLEAVMPHLKRTSVEQASSLQGINVDFRLITNKSAVRADLMHDAELAMQAGLIVSVHGMERMLSVLDDVDQHLKDRGL